MKRIILLLTEKFLDKGEYIISGLEIKPKEVDFTKWNEFTIIKQLSDRINKAKKKTRKTK